MVLLELLVDFLDLAAHFQSSLDGHIDVQQEQGNRLDIGSTTVLAIECVPCLLQHFLDTVEDLQTVLTHFKSVFQV